MDMHSDKSQPFIKTEPAQVSCQVEEIEGVRSDEFESKPIVEEIATVKVENVNIRNFCTEIEDHNPFNTRLAIPKLKKVKPAICTKCNTGFPNPDLYERHMSTVHKDALRFACGHCDKRFATRSNAMRHETIHDLNRYKGPPQFGCDLCDKRYHVQGTLDSHRQRIHFGYKPKKGSSPVIKMHRSTSDVKNPNPFKKPLETFQCPHCDLQFNHKCLMKDHIVVHTRERSHSCSICQQPFATRKTLRRHMKTIHESATTPTGIIRPRPRFQKGQPCPCTICGKVFKVPSKLAKHSMLHSGEKPHECATCGQRFRLAQGLQNHQKCHRTPDPSGMNNFKCRICGKEGFSGRFSQFRKHRFGKHGHIPYESEKEKAFSCGVCGKPYFLRIKATICALLGHDPSSLQKTMFKNKCPECPPERFGYHNLAYLRRHWETEHSDKVLPVPFRLGSYEDGQEGKMKDNFPAVAIDKLKKAEIVKMGIAGQQVKYEYPLFIELGLLPISGERSMMVNIIDKLAVNRLLNNMIVQIKLFRCDTETDI